VIRELFERIRGRGKSNDVRADLLKSRSHIVLDNWPPGRDIGTLEGRRPTPFRPGEPRVYFVLSCARSGSTSLAHILDTATNGICLSEPYPNLNIETRDMMEGRLAAPHRMLAETIFPRIARTLDKGLIHGEKNVTYGPFVPHLHEMLRCRFIFLKRDGRDVVASLMNWHNDVFGSVYRECREESPLSELARQTVAALPLEKDESDYARPRPLPGDSCYDRWLDFSRFEMAAWYWQFINRYYRQQLAFLPRDAWVEVDYTSITVERIGALFDFLGLEGFEPHKVEAMLARRINSIEDRIGQNGKFPKWSQWDIERQHQFDAIAADAMREFGYYLHGET
jgi:hypothetical protein